MEFLPGGPIFAAAALILIGFSVGVCGGFFGIGGAFIVTPALNVLGFPMAQAIGTDLAHMAGKSVVATLRHRRARHVDFRAAALLALGTLPGVRLGNHVIMSLERIGRTDLYVRAAYVVLLFVLGALMLRGSRREGAGPPGVFRAFRLPPMISLPRSQISKVSIWLVIGIGALTGFLAGFLGVGGGFIRMPALLYILGMPTKVAIGTDLVEVAFSGAYGSYLYGRSGHVDLAAALVMLVGAALGSQIGAVATQYVDSSRIRRLFALMIIGAGAAVAMKQMHWTLSAAITLFGLGLVVTSAIIRDLVRALHSGAREVGKEIEDVTCDDVQAFVAAADKEARSAGSRCGR